MFSWFRSSPKKSTMSSATLQVEALNNGMVNSSDVNSSPCWRNLGSLGGENIFATYGRGMAFTKSILNTEPFLTVITWCLPFSSPCAPKPALAFELMGNSTAGINKFTLYFVQSIIVHVHHTDWVIVRKPTDLHPIDSYEFSWIIDRYPIGFGSQMLFTDWSGSKLDCTIVDVMIGPLRYQCLEYASPNRTAPSWPCPRRASIYQLCSSGETELRHTTFDTQLIDTQRINTRLIDTRLIDTQLINTRLIDTRLIDTQPIDTQLIDTQLIKMQLIKMQLINTQLMNTQLIVCNYTVTHRYHRYRLQVTVRSSLRAACCWLLLCVLCVQCAGCCCVRRPESHTHSVLCRAQTHGTWITYEHESRWLQQHTELESQRAAESRTFTQ